MDKLKLLLTAAIGASGKEATFGGVAAFLGYFATEYLGGWDNALKILIALMVVDYVTGVLGAFRTRSVNSETMFWGGVRKAVVIVVIALAAMADQFVGASAPVFRTLAIYFYAGREGLSVVENFGTIGVALPPGLTKFFEQLQQKGEGDK